MVSGSVRVCFGVAGAFLTLPGTCQLNDEVSIVSSDVLLDYDASESQSIISI